MFLDFKQSFNQKLCYFQTTQIELHIKREDQIHKQISGNKYRKLKYNLIEAQQQNHTTLLTFGGAFSNHIAAVAAAGKQFNFQTIGVIRGEELSTKATKNPTLSFAKQQGMYLHFIDRTTYRNKASKKFIAELKQQFGDFYLLPEGGTNALAIKGCEEILTKNDTAFDYICCAVGTGGTLAGLINGSQSHQQILGFSALKGEFLKREIAKFTNKTNWTLISDYHFGGYAKTTIELIHFINTFKQQYKILLDPIYTGKMIYGVFNLLEKKYFKANSKILLIHTGGLQGIEGMNRTLQQKGLPLIR